MNTFADREKLVFDFIDDVDRELKAKAEEDKFKNSTNYKLKELDKCQADANNICIDELFAKLYNDAIPFNDEYKNAQRDQIKKVYTDFMTNKCPNGIEYYIREKMKNNNEFAKKVIEAVENYVGQKYNDMALNIEDYTADELKFKKDADVEDRIADISRELSIPEISEIIKNNVKKTTIDEIIKAKEEKERMKSLEDELANDINIRNEEDAKRAMELKGVTESVRDYTPSLFNAIFINKLNKNLKLINESAFPDTYLYNALEEYGYDTNSGIATAEEVAFTEAVEEYTLLSMMKALKFESMNKYEVSDLTDYYAQARV